MTLESFNFILPELFLLLLLNVYLLYALFFSGLGQKCQTSGESLNLQAGVGDIPLALPGFPKVETSQKLSVKSEKEKDFKSGKLSLAGFPQSAAKLKNIEDNLRSQNQSIKLAYLATPLQIVEPLSWLIVLGLGFSVVLLLNNPVSLASAVCLTNSYICDTYATFFKALICLSSAAAISLGVPAFKSSTVEHRIHNYEFLLVIFLSVLGMLCLVSSYNFLTFYLSIELQSLSFYLLACSKAKSEFSAEAGLKYFILGAFSSAFLLFGVSLVYGSTGSIYFDDVAALLEFSFGSELSQNFARGAAFTVDLSLSQIGLTIGLACICISLLFKLAAVPFHMWAPDVYEGSPMGITAFFAIASKIAALATLARFVIYTEQSLLDFLSFVAIASLTVGTLSAMRQVKMKRLIAFSGISNVGWFILGLCCGRLDAVMLHLMVYILTSITLFSIITQPIHRQTGGVRGNAEENLTLKHISDLGQVYKSNAVMALALTLAFFSLGGIPFLAGFYSKYLIINASIQAEALGLLSIGLVSAVLSAFYYLRVVKTIYFMEASNNWFTFSKPSFANAYLISCTTFFTAFFVTYPECLSVWLIHTCS